MIPDAAFDKIANELVVLGEEFITNRVTSQSVVDEATAVVRDAVRESLENSGYDTSSKFILALISKSIVKTEMRGDTFEFVFVHDFKNKKIVSTWNTKNNGRQSSSIQSKELAEIINDGRPSFTIEGTNTEHGLIAIPPPGEEYNPNNKDNAVVDSVEMPAKEGVFYMEHAKDALAAWVDKKHKQLLKEFQAEMQNLLRRNIGL